MILLLVNLAGDQIENYLITVSVLILINMKMMFHQTVKIVMSLVKIAINHNVKLASIIEFQLIRFLCNAIVHKDQYRMSLLNGVQHAKWEYYKK